MPSHPTKSYEQSKNTAKVLTQQVVYSGPIPPPEVLAKYEQLQSGLAERIVQMAENQAEHRQQLEKKQLESSVKHIESRDKEASRGQKFALTIALFALIGSIYLISAGYPGSGSFMAVMGISPIITAFLYSCKKENKTT